jgi:hypothetical protein
MSKAQQAHPTLLLAVTEKPELTQEKIQSTTHCTKGETNVFCSTTGQPSSRAASQFRSKNSCFNRMFQSEPLTEFIKDEEFHGFMRRSLPDAVKDFVGRLVEKRQAKKELNRAEAAVSEQEATLKRSENELLATRSSIEKQNSMIHETAERIRSLQKTLETQQSDLGQLNDKQEKQTAQVSKETAHLKILQVAVDEAALALEGTSKSMEVTLAKNHPGPEKKSPVMVSNDASHTKIIHALGDLHGWAPGLINYLTQHGLAKIEISGTQVYDEDQDGNLTVNGQAMSMLFPDFAEHFGGSGDDTQALLEWPHAGILGHSVNGTITNVDSIYTAISAQWTGKDEFLIQAGDIFDRADHSELAAEILRQLVIQAPAHVYVLVGNHEEFLLLDNYDSWHLNEAKWTYDTKTKGGNTRALPAIYSGRSETDLLQDTWDFYRSSAATLYLTQYFAKKPHTPNAETPLPFLSAAETNAYAERILNGGWSGYDAAYELHLRILEHIQQEDFTYPGAIAGLGIGDTWFMHAEPNGLTDFFKSVSDETLRQLKIPVMIGGRNVLLLEMRVKYRSGNDDYRSECTELFWARDASTGFEALSSRFSSQTNVVLRVLPGVRNIVHGHSPVPMNLEGNQPHTYLARSSTRPVTPTTGSIRVYNIDEGMTPVYHYYMDFESNLAKMSHVPIGLRVPTAIQPYHASGDLIADEDLWTLHEMFLENDSPPFTVNTELSLNDVPEQYKVRGPGQVTIPEGMVPGTNLLWTTPDEFRDSPVRFSWIQLEFPQNLENPLARNAPPPDGRYRVQHPTLGSIPLIKNLLKMLEDEANHAIPFSSSTTQDYLEMMRTDYSSAPPAYKKWGAVMDSYNAKAMFVTFAIDSSEQQLNVAALNMTGATVTVRISEEMPETGSVTYNDFEAEVPPGTCFAISHKLIKPGSSIDIELQHEERKTTVAQSIIFGGSELPPLNSSSPYVPYIEELAKKYESEDDVPAVVRPTWEKRRESIVTSDEQPTSIEVIETVREDFKPDPEQLAKLEAAAGGGIAPTNVGEDETNEPTDKSDIEKETPPKTDGTVVEGFRPSDADRAKVHKATDGTAATNVGEDERNEPTDKPGGVLDSNHDGDPNPKETPIPSISQPKPPALSHGITTELAKAAGKGSMEVLDPKKMKEIKGLREEADRMRKERENGDSSGTS